MNKALMIFVYYLTRVTLSKCLVYFTKERYVLKKIDTPIGIPNTCVRFTTSFLYNSILYVLVNRKSV
ncbi:hypothetical protein FPV252 [Fowlpox virus]|uniref:Uncharacterized protein FPV009/FPV252 n=2 Tax=Fowlpox virus TaxID=10261 RepID=V009_FOWPN|nr:hypothetical protein FPV009 [Fowlpox virus]NP_039215.1 hypothetical protein FPV252 [Fowlpox virus]Q9YPK0.1 RecName: Full=Uncharacterized protein FPV009/FPV252; AltName: Full=ORF b [Fowlpox virus strain NVSL]UNS14179.1 ALPV-015 [Albatrosspox virus]WPD90960.1 hypothetical protein PPV_Vac110-fpv009 [Avipoxvirus sp.]CAE52555.1 hypothetical protein [Fowlpox virus isolate HP-438/Munich]AAF44601.1 ORF FPV009 hypothetical protein [Fowlpox virus]AAF44613.1 ORF FPV252 hypothetical protein [Fowlpox 